MNYICIISIIEACYLFYMFYIFETNIDFNVFSSPSNYWFKHLVGNEKGLRICLFGQIMAIPAIIILLLRCVNEKIANVVIKPVIYISMILSLLNMNAIVYLLPIWMIEYFLTMKFLF